MGCVVRGLEAGDRFVWRLRGLEELHLSSTALLSPGYMEDLMSSPMTSPSSSYSQESSKGSGTEGLRWDSYCTSVICSHGPLPEVIQGQSHRQSGA